MTNMHRALALLAAALCLLVAACGGGGGSSGGSGGGSGSSSSSSAALTLTIHYKRLDNDYSGWGLHLWNDTTGTAAIASGTVTTWTSPRAFDSVTGGWATAIIPLSNSNAHLNFLIHKGDAKSPMLDLRVNHATFGSDVWVVQETGTLYATQAAADTAAAKVGRQAESLDMAAVPVGTTTSALPAGWSQRGQFMEIFVRSYKDSDGDGRGDLKGLTSKLDYLQSLGVTGLWLMPVFESQDNDHGYAVADYRAIERDYGTMADFDELVTQAHARGIGIVLDYVMNHSAAQNPLFLDAVSSPTNSRRDWYVFNATDPNWSTWGGNPWRPTAYGYNYGLFADIMPDFNLKNPAVVAWHMDNLRFWLNRGVDGFRFDAVETFVENGSANWYNQPETHAVLIQARNTINSYANRYMVCEAPDHPGDYAGASCGHVFAFGRQSDIRTTATSGAMTAGLAAHFASPQRSVLPLFLSNHDSFAGSRPIVELSGHAEGDYRIAAAIAILGSDTPFAYYGEEIGMGSNGESGDASLRAPMSWTNTVAGFTSGTPYRTVASNLASYNAAAQTGVSVSLLETYRGLYAVRTANPLLQSGTLTLLSAAGDPRVVFLRRQAAQTAVVLINLSTTSQTMTADTGLSVTTFATIYPTTGATVTSNASGRITMTIPAQGVAIVRTP
ncbi:alpha-amylase family glycosyl hydrolase [Asticcacaulis sp. AC402]|uniref:alpha-amylase family glycosyl hydrolase n=1 Tax=Asticcacaulis sp. AC402 TaxID=1282361 RepID=UPI0003C3ADFB|nr:alpha-amylase family glycosyl hydrolase [Asticcacaulis sp. AC402]ESQ73967.1 hypothetical protein ABAC402_16505 [Asticcacaulis sp. AC402]